MKKTRTTCKKNKNKTQHFEKKRRNTTPCEKKIAKNKSRNPLHNNFHFIKRKRNKTHCKKKLANKQNKTLCKKKLQKTRTNHNTLQKTSSQKKKKPFK